MSDQPTAVSNSQVYILDPMEINLLLRRIDPANPENAGVSDESRERKVKDYLTRYQFPLDQPGKNSKCPAVKIPSGTITRSTSAFEKYAPLFSTPTSITARTLETLLLVLKPYADKKTGPATSPHTCLEIATTPQGNVNITAWNPFKKNK